MSSWERTPLMFSCRCVWTTTPGLLPFGHHQTHPCFATTPGADIIAQALTNNTSLITLKVKTKHGGRAEIDEASDKTVRVLRGAAAAAVRPPLAAPLSAFH